MQYVRLFFDGRDKFLFFHSIFVKKDKEYFHDRGIQLNFTSLKAYIHLHEINDSW